MIALVILAASGCLALAWWQWTRFESNSGTFQNLGYALQWPFFAGFCVYAYRKFVRFEEAPPVLADASSTQIPEGLLPERPSAASSGDDDPELQQYNAYLAELARSDSATKVDEPQDRTTA